MARPFSITFRKGLLSVSIHHSDPERAILEWQPLKLATISDKDEQVKCICGVIIPKHDYIFKNKINHTKIHVGKECFAFFNDADFSTTPSQPPRQQYQQQGDLKDVDSSSDDDSSDTSSDSDGNSDGNSDDSSDDTSDTSDDTSDSDHDKIDVSAVQRPYTADDTVYINVFKKQTEAYFAAKGHSITITAELAPLANYYEDKKIPVVYSDHNWKSAQRAIEAERFFDPYSNKQEPRNINYRQRISDAATSGIAKRLGEQKTGVGTEYLLINPIILQSIQDGVKTRANWDVFKYD
jgi:hypothetical protein